MDKILNIDGWKIYDLPIKYKESDYDDARLEVVKQAENSPELAALFEFGYIPNPGISDMDFWAVFPDDAKIMNISTTPYLSEKSGYLVKHQITVISEKHYKKMLYFDPWTVNVWPNGHRLLYQRSDIKRDLNFKNIEFTKEEFEVLSLARVEEVLKSIQHTIPLYAKKELPVRDLFDSLKSCIYIAREVNNITNQKIDSNFSEEFKKLMDNWFEIDTEEGSRKLINLFYEGLLITFKCSFILGEWAKKYSRLVDVSEIGIRKTSLLNKSLLDGEGGSVYINTFGERRVYSDTIKTPEQALEISLNSYKKIYINLGKRSKTIDFYVIFQSLDAAAVPLGFIVEDGLLSNSLKKDTYSNMDQLPVLKHKIFKEKVDMINEITKIYNAKQGIGGKGWLFGNNQWGYLFEREKLRRKILSFYLRRKFWRALNK